MPYTRAAIFSSGLGLAVVAALPTTALTTFRQVPARFDFRIAVALSPKATARLNGLSERVLASASFYGDPVPSAVKHADEVGRINLGDEKVFVTSGVAHFTGSKIKRARLPWLRRGAIEVNINVYTARLSGPDNLLTCDFFQGPIEQARKGDLKLNCKLITEG